MTTDSTVGKILEKAGGLLHKDNLVEKGHSKREAAGFNDQSESNY